MSSAIKKDSDTGLSFSDEDDRSREIARNLEMDLECGKLEMEVEQHSCYSDEKTTDIDIMERICRICHMNLMEEPWCGVAIELKCDCKGDLGAAHQHCADTWFNIRGNRCEICGSIAHYVSKEEHRKKDYANSERQTLEEAFTTAPEIQDEARRNKIGRRIMNFLLTCMILAFVVSWLFHLHILH